MLPAALPCFHLITLLLLCQLVPFYYFFSLYYLLLCLVSFTLLYLITPAAALSSCSPLLFFLYVPPAALPCSPPLLFFLSLPLLLLYLLVPLYYSFSYYPCCSALFPTNLLSLCVPCWFASIPFTHLYHIIPIATLSSCFL